MGYSWAKKSAVFKKTNGRCYNCGKEIQMKHLFYQDTYMAIRKLVPKEYGGDDKIDNLLALCRECNNKIEHQIQILKL